MGGGNPINAVTNTVKNTVGGIAKNPLNALPTVQLGNMVKAGGMLPSLGGGSILNDITGKNAQNDALAAQTRGMESANASLSNAYGQQQEYLNPYAQAGTTALDQYAKGNFVNPQDIANNPAYQFRLAEGTKAVNSNALARGMGQSGATMKALMKYGQGLASTEYDNAYNRENQRLGNLTGMGQNAANNLSNAAGSFGSNLSNNYTGLGNAQASSAIAGHNNMMQMAQMGLQGAAMFSDERLKENIRPLTKAEILEMRPFLKAYAWNYKNKKHGEGNWMGIMAQDLEKSEAGRSLVITNSKGEKTLNQQKILSTFLAFMAEGF